MMENNGRMKMNEGESIASSLSSTARSVSNETSPSEISISPLSLRASLYHNYHFSSANKE